MKRFLSVVVCLALFFVSRAQTSEFYVGSFTSEGGEGISLCAFLPETGEVILKSVFKGIDNPNFLRKSQDGKYLYVVSRSPHLADPSGGSVVAFRILENHDLEFINKQSSLGEDPCYVDVSPDGKWVAAANYGGGSVVLFAVQPSGGLLPPSSLVRHDGKGPDPQRQDKAYAHSIRFAGQEDLLYAADLGTDKLYAYTLDRMAARLVPSQNPFVSLPPGSGPRHFEFSSDRNNCYVINELNSTLTVFSNEKGKMKEVQTVSTLPEGWTGKSYCADIHLSPCENWLYASNRGHNSIAVFRRATSGQVALETCIPCQGEWPRNFAIDPTGKFLLVANQWSHQLVVFRLEKGIPVYTGNMLKINSPVCIEFLQ